MKRILTALFCATALLGISLISSCSDSDSSGSHNNESGEGTGGSMARFTISGDYIYTVDHNSLKVTRIADPAKPEHVNTYALSNFRGDIETIFPYDGKLFIGSRSAMYIYDIVGDPECPQLLSYTSHFNSCDPVVAYGDYAYVTLSNGNQTCFRGVNELQIYDISNINNPVRVRTFDYGSLKPAGLGVDGTAGKLFVCTDKGVKIYDLGDDHSQITLAGEISNVPGVGTINAYDVITLSGLLIVTGESGLFQFDYTQEPVKFLSSIDLR